MCAHACIGIQCAVRLFLRRNVFICFACELLSCRRRNRRKRIKEGEKERKRKKCVCWRKNLPLSIIHSRIAVLKISLRNEYFMYAKSALQFFIVFFSHTRFCFVLFYDGFFLCFLFLIESKSH